MRLAPLPLRRSAHQIHRRTFRSRSPLHFCRPRLRCPHFPFFHRHAHRLNPPPAHSHHRFPPSHLGRAHGRNEHRRSHRSDGQRLRQSHVPRFLAPPVQPRFARLGEILDRASESRRE